MTTIGIIGAGHIGSAVARKAVELGYDVVISNSRGPETLTELATELGPKARAATSAEAAEAGHFAVVTVPLKNYRDIPVEPLAGKIVIDTTNQYGSEKLPPEGQTAAQWNASRMPGARYTKSFNTLTSSFQAEAAGRPEGDRVVQWICGDDAEAKGIVAKLIADAGYAPVDLGGTADCAVMEAPQREGAVYGEEYRLPDAEQVVEAVKAGEQIPPKPKYE